MQPVSRALPSLSPSLPEPNVGAPKAPVASASVTSTAASERVTRPDVGLRRGVWEAPVWSFWLVLILAALAAAGFVWRERRQSKAP